MKRFYIGIIVYTMIIIFPFGSIFAQSNETVSNWLLTSCVVGQESGFVIQLSAVGSQALPQLISAAQNGPDTGLISAEQTRAGADYDQLNQSYPTAGQFGISPTDVQALQNITRQEYVSEDLQDFILRYQSAALVGLGIIGGDQATAVLQSFAQDAGSPLQDVAQHALHPDAIPPTTAAALAPQPNSSGWNNHNVTVTLTSTDNSGGSGMKEITYSETGSQTITPTNILGGLAAFLISTEGTTTVAYFGTDNAGNVETSKSVTVLLDKTPPTINAFRSPAANTNGWNNNPVTVTFQCADALSGVVAASIPTPTTLSSEGAGQSVTGACQDLAGNSASANVHGINIDMTPPMIVVSAASSSLWPPNGKLVPDIISGKMTDALSGIDPSTAAFHVVDEYGTIQPSGNITMMPDGSYSFTLVLEARRLGQDLDGRRYQIIVTASDKSGNSASASTGVVVPHDQGK